MLQVSTDEEQTFRPHTDDSFPISACINNRLIWDVPEGKPMPVCLQTEGQQASGLTCLLYLTEEFEGGHTTFFQVLAY